MSALGVGECRFGFGVLLPGGLWLTFRARARSVALCGLLLILLAAVYARVMLIGEGRGRIVFGRVGAFDVVRRERLGRRCGQTVPGFGVMGPARLV